VCVDGSEATRLGGSVLKTSMASDGAAWLVPLVPALEAVQRETAALAATHAELLAHNERVCTLAQRQAQVLDNMAAIAAAPAAMPTVPSVPTRP
jgi:hypothetical protein